MASERELVERSAGEGFLRAYVGFASDLTDAPPLFHVATGLSILGAAMGNRVRIRSFGGVHLFPNLWAVVISPSGFYRKTTALRIGRNLLGEALGATVLLPDDFTPEKLGEILARRSAGLLCAYEFARVLEMLGREYNRGTREMLTELFDSPALYVQARKLGGDQEIRDAAPSILGATTLDWLKETVRQGDLTGGFLARYLFLPGSEKGPRIRGIPVPNGQVKEELVQYLRAVGQLKGEADFSQVEDAYDGWLAQYEATVNKGRIPKELIGVYSRAGTHILKLAVLFHVAQGGGQLTLTVSPEALFKAQTFLVEVLNLTRRLVEEEFAFSWLDAQRKQILGHLRENGQLQRQDLIRLCRNLSAKKLDEVLATLRESEEVLQETQRPEGGRGRPAIVYHLGPGADPTRHNGARP